MSDETNSAINAILIFGIIALILCIAIAVTQASDACRARGGVFVLQNGLCLSKDILK